MFSGRDQGKRTTNTETEEKNRRLKRSRALTPKKRKEETHRRDYMVDGAGVQTLVCEVLNLTV
jgi:hypothetical protein